MTILALLLLWSRRRGRRIVIGRRRLCLDRLSTALRLLYIRGGRGRQAVFDAKSLHVDCRELVTHSLAFWLPVRRVRTNYTLIELGPLVEFEG